MIKILLADDHEVIRAGLKEYLRKTMPDAVIEETGDGDTTFEKIKRNDYALIILDINMPDTDSFGLVSNILALKPRSGILIFSMNPEEIYARKYLKLGALGYLNKEASIDEVRKAVENVIDHKKYLSPSLTQQLLDHALTGKTNNNNPFDELSPRELEITRHLLKGESLSTIGSSLHLHTSTVGTHKARIFRKLHCKNNMEVLGLARLHHFIQPN